MMMVINPKGKLARWAYFFTEYGPPSATTLCAFFWRSFFFVPLSWLTIVTLVGMVLFLLGSFAYHLPAIACSVGATIALLIFLGPKISKNSYEIEDKLDGVWETVSESTFGQGVKAIKGKFCPIIYFEE